MDDARQFPVLEREQIDELISVSEGATSDLFRELLDLFVAENQPWRDELGVAINQGDLVTVRDQAHAIKGSSSNIGGYRLSKVAHHIEAAAHDGDIQTCRDAFPMLLDAWEQTTRAIEDIIEKHS